MNKSQYEVIVAQVMADMNEAIDAESLNEITRSVGLAQTKALLGILRTLRAIQTAVEK
jgi:hypothetical protein